ncbi:MAG: methyltransferase domain-containing protein [Pseudomonadota bacterium]
MPALGAGVLEWLSPRAGERILDLGCGDGTLTRELVDVGANVVGVDASQSFVLSAAERGIDARVMDGCELSFDTEFDAVFSNAAIHWMTDPAAVVSGVRRALKPSGRFVAEFGGHGNVAAIVTAMQAVAARFDVDPALAHPWYFPTLEEYSDLLQQHGFVVERIALIPRPTPLPTGLRGWIQTFREPLFAAAGPDRDEALSFAETLLARSLRDRAGRWTADYVRIRVEAHAVDHAK